MSNIYVYNMSVKQTNVKIIVSFNEFLCTRHKSSVYSSCIYIYIFEISMGLVNPAPS